jgi:drug/metabolite transporter (DMT)-like permease
VSPTTSPASRVVRGIAFICVAVTLFACMNTAVKLLNHQYSSLQLVWARTLGHLIFILAIFMPRKGWALFRTGQLGTHFTRSIAVLVGFVGVIIVMRPGSELFQWASLFVVASSFCYAAYTVLTRCVAARDAAETSAVYSVVVGSVLLSALMPYCWIAPANGLYIGWRESRKV